jgi:AraC-like DNA-binding protein
MKTAAQRERMKPAAGGIQIISVGHVEPDSHWHMAAHRHAFHELILVQAGRIHVEGDGRVVTGAAGDLLLYPAGVRHAERSDPRHPVETRFVAFAGGDLGGGELTRMHDTRGRIRQMMHWIVEDSREDSAEGRVSRAMLLQAVLAEFKRGSGAEPHPVVALTRRHVHDHISERLSLAELAAAVGLSKFHFLRVYKEAAGVTPMQDVRLIRANYARDLIFGTQLPLKEIAPRAGLGDEYALSRVFRKLFDGAPGQFRRFRRR